MYLLSVKRKNADKNRRKIKDINLIKKLYLKEKKSLKVIGKLLNVSSATVMKFCNDNKIKLRTLSEAGKNISDERREQLRQAGIKSYLERKKFGTQPELDFEKWMKEKNIKFEEQYRKIGNGHPYDYFLKDYNLLVEIDGYFWHNKKKQKEKDKKHNNDAIAKGYRIVRICTKKLKECNGDYSKWIYLN